jgi:3-dehydroquinate synthase
MLDRIERYLQSWKIPSSSAPFLLPGGEQVKAGFSHVERLIDFFDRERLCRQSLIVALGGGAVLDVAGFAAALVHRGVRLLRLPTTSVAQGDSGIGVKNGINFAEEKNFLGVFAPPHGVLCDLTFLQTLDGGLLADGLAEAIKVAMIKNGSFFHEIEQQALEIEERNWPVIESIIRQSGEIHYRHIATSGDPFERGSARPLDFGHWAGHRLEKMSGYSIRHGEGVALGIALDTVYAQIQGMLAEQERDRVLSLFEKLHLPVYHPLMEKEDDSGVLEVLGGLNDFREHLGGELSIPLPLRIGEAVEFHEMSADDVKAAISFLKAFSRHS